MTGTLANAGAIIIGSLAGMLIQSRLSEKMTGIIFQVLGLFTIVVGISMAIRAEEMILVVVSLVFGAIVGQAIDIDRYLRRFSDALIQRTTSSKEAGTRFTEGFMTATMLYCIGSLAILGAIEDGMGETPNLLYTKSIMDGISAIALASTFGIAILVSAFPVLIYQGTLTLLAAWIMGFMSESMIADMTATGGILLIGLGINILKIKEIQVTNMLPALVFIVILSYLF